MNDSTIFEESERLFTPSLVSATATIGKFYTVDNYFMDMILNKETMVIEFFADSGEDPFIVYANVSSDSITVPVEALIEESISLQITNKMIVEV